MKKLVLAIAFMGIGSLAMAQTTEARTPKSKEEMVKKMQDMRQAKLDKMKQELNLTPAQVTQLDQLFQEQAKIRKTEMQVRNKQMMEERKAQADKREADLKKILTPEQYTKYKALKEEQQKKKKTARHGKDVQKVKHMEFQTK